MRQGTVKWSSAKGFALITPDDGGSDVYVSPSALPFVGYRPLQQDQRVEFTTGQGSRNRAEIVRLVGGHPPFMPGPPAQMVLPGVPLEAGDPDAIGQYAILRRLGQGTMGIVYLARGPDEKSIALKVVRPEWAHEADFLRRFAQEVKHASRVDAAYTSKVVSVSADPSRPYLAAEFVDGPTLEAEVTLNGPLPSSRAMTVAIGTAAALIAIHEAGIVHRDLKPSNVLLSRFGPRVIDFGIARALGATTRLTQTGGRVGAPAYMSPEQILDADLTSASDVFSWAGMMVYASTGHQPFGGPDTNMIALYWKVLEGQPNLADVPVALQPILEAAFAKEATARPTARDLLAFLTGSHSAVGNPSELADRAIRKIVELPSPAIGILSGAADGRLPATRPPVNPLPPLSGNLSPVFMPPLGDTILEGTVERWLIKEGKHVRSGEPLVRVSSDMCWCDVPSPDSGVLRDIAVDKDETVPISTQLAVIDMSPAERSSDEPFQHTGWSWSPPPMPRPG